MVRDHGHDELWRHWFIIFAISITLYTITYTCVFRRQLSYTKQSTPNTTTKDENRSPHEQQNDEIIEEIQKGVKANTGAAECIFYAGCVGSMCNAIVCVAGALCLLYAPYWNNSHTHNILYGEPLFAFYLTPIVESYFLIDLLSQIVLPLIYSLPSTKYDIIYHHLMSLSYVTWIITPKPIYAWAITLLCFAMEFSTIFLNISFFAKWYKWSAKNIQNVKLMFVIAWFAVRLPGAIAWVVLLCLYGHAMFDEYPLDKFICVVLFSFINLSLQVSWSVLIVKKTYRAIMAKKEDIIGENVESTHPPMDSSNSSGNTDVTLEP
eukprot:7838_1